GLLGKNLFSALLFEFRPINAGHNRVENAPLCFLPQRRQELIAAHDIIAEVHGSFTGFHPFLVIGSPVRVSRVTAYAELTLQMANNIAKDYLSHADFNDLEGINQEKQGTIVESLFARVCLHALSREHGFKRSQSIPL